MIGLIDLRHITNKGLPSGRKYGEILASNLSERWGTDPKAVEILVNETDLVTSSFFVGIMTTLATAKAWRLIGANSRTQDEYWRALRRIQGVNHGREIYTSGGASISKTWYHIDPSSRTG